MKPRTMLTIASLLSVVLFTLHLADDIVRGIEKGQLSNLWALPIAVVWMYGTLVLSERRSGYFVTLVLNALGTAVPFLHFSGKGVGIYSRIAGTDGALLFVWTLVALGVTSLFAAVVAARALWNPRWAQSPIG